MSVELLLLTILGGITLLAYMIAINSHGPTRLSISYLLATVLLAATVWAVVQHVNSGQDQMYQAKLRQEAQIREEAEKQKGEAEKALVESRGHATFAAKLNTYINQGTGLATTLINIDVRDMSMELDALVARANDARSKCVALQTEFGKVTTDDDFFGPSMGLVKDAITTLAESAQYYTLYYRSDDSAQEELRERVMRQKAREAYEKFQKASAMVATAN
jgi:hypothetical protein